MRSLPAIGLATAVTSLLALAGGGSAAASKRALSPRSFAFGAGDRRALKESAADACGVAAVPYVGDIGLTARRLPNPPLICP